MAAGLDAIGGTPLVRLRSCEPEGGGELWAKWEGANPTGSMKDRMAAGMVAHGERTGALRAGMRVVEYTGGSTGSSLAMVCAAKGYRAHLVTADCYAAEKISTMRAFGAAVEVLESDGGKVTPELFDRFKARIAELAAEPETWWAEQFVARERSRLLREDTDAELAVSRARMWQTTSLDQLRAAVTSANKSIVAANARLEPADRLPLIDYHDAVARWRRARPAG